jgi:hypothetical protein
LEDIWFHLSILPGYTAVTPDGFLFLSPPKHFQSGQSSLKWPECPAYWSLDPFGADRLGWEAAANLGFPSLKLSASIWGRSWDASVYTGLRQFHQAKGFDSESQDVARYLGHPLYAFSADTSIPFAHGESTVLNSLIFAKKFNS